MDVSGLPFWLQWYCNRQNKRKKKPAQTSELPFLLQWYCNRLNKRKKKLAQTSGLPFLVMILQQTEQAVTRKARSNERASYL